MVNWYKQQPITIKAAIIGGLFAILGAIITILPDVLMHPSKVILPKNGTIPTPTDILYYDDFSDKTSGWNINGYSNGWYKILFNTGYEKNYFTWDSIGPIDGFFGIRVTVIGPFEKNGRASRGLIFGLNNGDTREPFSFSFDYAGKCKISYYSTAFDHEGWRMVTEGQIENFDNNQSFYKLELQNINYRQVIGSVDGNICIDTVLDSYVPGLVGLYASPTYGDSDGMWYGESFFDDFFVYRL
jgi:hypothetical protein